MAATSTIRLAARRTMAQIKFPAGLLHQRGCGRRIGLSHYDDVMLRSPRDMGRSDASILLYSLLSIIRTKSNAQVWCQQDHGYSTNHSHQCLFGHRLYDANNTLALAAPVGKRVITIRCTLSTHSGGCEVVRFSFVPGDR